MFLLAADQLLTNAGLCVDMIRICFDGAYLLRRAMTVPVVNMGRCFLQATAVYRIDRIAVIGMGMLLALFQSADQYRFRMINALLIAAANACGFALSIIFLGGGVL